MGDRIPLDIHIDPSLGPDSADQSTQPQHATGLYFTLYEYRWTIFIISVVIVLLAVLLYAYIMRDGENARTMSSAQCSRPPPSVPARQNQAPVQSQAPPEPQEPVAPVAADEPQLETVAAATLTPAKEELLATRAALLEEKPEEQPAEAPAVQEKQADAPYVPPKKCVKLRCKGYATFGDFIEKHSGAK